MAMRAREHIESCMLRSPRVLRRYVGARSTPASLASGMPASLREEGPSDAARGRNAPPRPMRRGSCPTYSHSSRDGPRRGRVGHGRVSAAPMLKA